MKPSCPTTLRRVILCAMLAALPLGRSGSAFGQQGSTTASSETIELPKYEVTEHGVNPYQAQQALSATRVAVAIQDVPQTLSVVTQDLIADAMSFRMLDAAKYVTPVVESTLPFGGDRYMIRGFQVSQEFIDGSVISGGSGYSMSIPQFNIDRIEVIKGPNAILVPGGSPGGVMNPITKEPLARNATSLTLDLAQYIGNDFAIDTNYVINASNHMAFRLVAGAWYNTHMYIHNMFRCGYEISPSFSVELSPTQKLVVKADIVQNRETNMGGLPIDPSIGSTQDAIIARGLPRDWSFGDDSDARHRSTERMSAELRSTMGNHVSSRLYVMADHVRRIDVGGTNSAINNVATRPAGAPASYALNGGTRNPLTGNWEPGVYWSTTTNADNTVTAVSATGALTDPSVWWYNHSVTRVDLEYEEAHLKNDYVAQFEGRWFKSMTLGGFTADFSKVRYKSWAAATNRPPVANNPAGATINGVTYPGLFAITYPAYLFPGITPSDFSPPVPPNTAKNPTATQSGGDIISKQSTLQGFLFETLNLFNDHLLLSGGVSRYYGVLNRTDSTLTSLNSSILLAAPSYSLLTTARSYGIVIKPIKEVSLFASRNTTGGTMPGELSPGTYLEHTTTFGPDPFHPRTDAVTGLIVPTTVTVQAFKPTSGSQDEFGVKTSLLNGTLTGSFSYFKISQQNYGVPNSDWYLLTAQGNTAAAALLQNPIYLNLDSKGWEIEGTYSLNKNLTILGNYTSFKERQPITEVRVRAVPDHAGALYIDYRFTDGVLKGFGMNVGIDYKSDVAGENVNGLTTTLPIAGGVGFVPQQPSFLVGGRTVVNVGFSYRTKNFSVRLQIANALNEDYILAAGSRGSLVEADPRSWKVSTTYNF